MKAGSLVRVVRQDPYDPQGPDLDAPVWDAVTLDVMGRVRHGEVFIVVRSEAELGGAQ